MKRVLTKCINEDISAYFRTVGRGNEPIFHIISGTSIGAIKVALLVSDVKENKTWEGSGERLVEFWEYVSTQPSVENIPYFTNYWDSWRGLDRRIASGESPEDTLALENLFLKNLLTCSYQRHPCPTLDFLIHQIPGISMTIDHLKENSKSSKVYISPQARKW